MLEPVLVPPQNAVDSWNKINDMPLVDTVPRSVPLSCLLRYPSETNFQRVISSRTPLPASRHERNIQILLKSVQNIDHYLSMVYPMRSLSAPISEYRNAHPDESNQFKTQESKEIANTLINNIYQLLIDEKKSAEDTSKILLTIWGETTIWEEGNYSSQMLDAISLIIYKMTAFEQLAPSKASITADISQFSQILSSKLDPNERITQNLDKQQDKILVRSWIASVHAHTELLLKQMINLTPDKTILVFNIFTDYLRKRIEANDYTYPELYYAYIVAYSYFINFYHQQMMKERQDLKDKKRPKYQIKPLSNEVIDFVEKLIEKFTNLPMVFEFNISFKDLILNEEVLVREKKGAGKIPPQINRLKMEEHLPLIRNHFEKITHLLEKAQAGYVTTEAVGSVLIDLLPQVLHDIASCMNSIREQILNVLTNSPPAENEEDKTSPFERSMRRGLKNSELNTIMLLLAICHNTKEQIEDNLPLVTEAINGTMQGIIQDFIKNKLAATIVRSEDKELTLIIEEIRAIMGDFQSDGDLKVVDKSVKKIQMKTTDRKAAPNPGMLELLRVQLQFLTNPESKFMNKPRALASIPLPEPDQKEILSFLEKSKYYGELIQLQDTLDMVCDQSALYFKEFYLSQTKGNFFPVKCSLPVILTDFALNYYQRSELTDAIFFPLSIYDDAAAKALRFFKSRMMYDEIKAEARICIQSITQLISDKSFHPLRRFASYQSFPGSIISEVTEDAALSLSDASAALRLRIALRQHQLFVLGCLIDTKGLIADRMNVLIEQELEKIIQLTESHGILAAISVTKLLQILQKEHSLLLGTGLPLLKFEDLLALACHSDTPNSLQSLLLVNYVQYISEKAIDNFWLMTNPLRLIPKKRVKVDIGSLHVGKDFCDQMQAILEPTFSMITIESFREAFKYLGDGSSALMQQQVVGLFEQLWQPLLQVYSAVQGKLTRIADSPITADCRSVYERFEGAYRNFVHDQEVTELFNVMGQLGNLLGICEMMDDAFLLQNLGEDQNIAFLTSRSPLSPESKSNDIDLFMGFDKKYQEISASIQSLTNLPSDENDKERVVQPFVSLLIQQFQAAVEENQSLFDETSPTILDQTSLKGFAAIWSVLEFIFELNEATRDPKEPGSFDLYGSGVLLSAAALLVVTGQQDLAKVLSIGSRFSAHQLLDFSFSTDVRIERFLNVHRLVYSTVECGITSYKPSAQ